MSLDPSSGSSLKVLESSPTPPTVYDVSSDDEDDDDIPTGLAVTGSYTGTPSVDPPPAPFTANVVSESLP